MVHAHLATPLAYGVPTMLMWAVAFLLAGAFTEQHFRRLRIAVVVMAAGFYLPVLMSFMSLMTIQFITTQQLGYWASKAIFAPTARPRFEQGPIYSTTSGSG